MTKITRGNPPNLKNVRSNRQPDAPTATVSACFRRFARERFATGCHRLQPQGSIKAP